MAEGRGARAGTVTVLFTDLVASTVLRQTLGDDQADVVRHEHDRLVRDASADHGGTEIKALGDGFMLVFAAAAEAVTAAVAMQQAIDRFSRRAPVPVQIRVGVSAGDVVWEDGDCFGTPVVEASRLCDAAAGGTIVVSDVVRLLAGSRGGHRFNPLGTLELKGLADPVSASEVTWEAADRGVLLPSALTTGSQGRFVGRAAEYDRLLAAWKDASTGTRRVALLSGEPGVGKTRLAAEVARLAHDDGATVLYGRCDEDLGVPYQPFVEALRPYVAACPPDELSVQVAPNGGDLARLVPQLAERLPGLPAALNADPETERYRLFDAITSFLAHIAATAPVLLVLDDLHWAAKPTLLLLRHLTRAEWTGPLFIIGTYRDTDLSRTHPLAEMLADLRREGDADRVALHGLDIHEVEQFVTAAAGHELEPEGTELARLLHDETEGNPFFMGQVLRHLVETGAIVEHDGRWVRGAGADELGIPEGVREVVGRRLARLQPATNDVLAAAAVIGRDFDRDILTAVAGTDAEAVLDALEEGERARLIATSDARRGGYGFVHALVRSTLYDEIPTTRRLRLHRRVGEALEARDVDSHVDELAYHFAEAAALGEAAKAVDYGRRAAGQAMARLAYEEAAADYERALASLDPESQADREARAELLVELGRAVWIGGERARAREHLAEAILLARDANRPDLLAEAAIISGGVRAWTEAGLVDDDFVALLEEVSRALPPGDTRLRAMALVRLASELYFQPGSVERRVALTAEAVAMARRLDDPSTLAYVLGASIWGLFGPDTVGDRETTAREMLALAEDSGDRTLEASARAWLVTARLEVGDVRGATDQAARELALAEELRQPELHWEALVHQVALANLAGRLDDGSRLAAEALAEGQQVGIESAVQMYGVAQFPLRRLRGGLAELVPVVVDMVERYPLIPAWRCALAYIYRELDRRDEARAQLEVIAADDFAMLPRDGNFMVGAAILATVCHLLADRERAAWLYDEFVPYQDVTVLAGLPADVLGSAHHFLMLLAATLERWDDLERHAAEALARNEEMGAKPWLAVTRLELAAVLVARDRPGDRDRAAPLLEACLAACAELDLPELAARARRVLEQRPT
jgi:class 3 adenylate cyclase/tetratricopeptide (TPR) repeat protein